MTLSREDAARALGDVDSAQARASTLAGYARQGDTLVAWGAMWLACNLVSQFAPPFAGRAWLAGTIAGVAATAWANRQGSGRAKGRRTALTFLVVILLLCGVFAVSPPQSPAALDAVVSLCVAGGYGLLGVWAGRRWLLLGAALFVLILAGWFAAPAWFFLWMALAGGGALIVGGLWLRRA